MQFRAVVVASVLVGAFAGCGSSSSTVDGGTRGDASKPTDAARQVDGSRKADAGKKADANEPTDAHKGVDSSEPADAHKGVDSSEPTDAHKGVDSSEPTDAHKGVDSSEPTDAHKAVDSSKPADAKKPVDAKLVPPVDGGSWCGANGGVCIAAGTCTKAGGSSLGTLDCSFSDGAGVCCVPPAPAVGDAGDSCNDLGGICTTIGGCTQAGGYFTGVTVSPACTGAPEFACCLPNDLCGPIPADENCCASTWSDTFECDHGKLACPAGTTLTDGPCAWMIDGGA
jgi:hypothetical protein